VEVLNAGAWENYRTRAAEVIASFAGRYLVRGARRSDPIRLAGRRVAPSERDRGRIPSMKALQGWYASPEYVEAFAFRAAAVKRRMVFVAGIDEAAEVLR
jgi:uncharacterized protein (DUF1330 family)